MSGEPARICPVDDDDAVILGTKMASKHRETRAPML